MAARALALAGAAVVSLFPPVYDFLYRYISHLKFHFVMNAVPNYNPLDIVDNLKRLINGELMVLPDSTTG